MILTFFLISGISSLIISIFTRIRKKLNKRIKLPIAILIVLPCMFVLCFCVQLFLVKYKTIATSITSGISIGCIIGIFLLSSDKTNKNMQNKESATEAKELMNNGLTTNDNAKSLISNDDKEKNHFNEDTTNLYYYLRTDKTKLSPNDINTLVNNFIDRSEHIELNPEFDYSVEFLPCLGFSGLLMIDEQNKKIIKFIVPEKNTATRIIVSPNSKTYQINCKIIPIAKSKNRLLEGTNNTHKKNVVSCRTNSQNSIAQLEKTSGINSYNENSIDSLLSSLERLNKLHNSGVVNDTEYQKIKESILE